MQVPDVVVRMSTLTPHERGSRLRAENILRAARAPRSVLRVLIDVRRSVPLGVGEKRAALVVPTPKPAPGTAFPPRRLILRGVPTFELNLWCGTCPALFKKLAEPEVADLGLANQRLNAGSTASITRSCGYTARCFLSRSTRSSCWK